jgi:hypothetical protein
MNFSVTQRHYYMLRSGSDLLSHVRSVMISFLSFVCSCFLCLLRLVACQARRVGVCIVCNDFGLISVKLPRWDMASLGYILTLVFVLVEWNNAVFYSNTFSKLTHSNPHTLCEFWCSSPVLRGNLCAFALHRCHLPYEKGIRRYPLKTTSMS